MYIRTTDGHRRIGHIAKDKDKTMVTTTIRLRFDGGSSSTAYHTSPKSNGLLLVRHPLPSYSTKITAALGVGYLKLESLKRRRTEADKKFFNGISQTDNCLHHLLPPPRDTQLFARSLS